MVAVAVVEKEGRLNSSIELSFVGMVLGVELDGD